MLGGRLSTKIFLSTERASALFMERPSRLDDDMASCTMWQDLDLYEMNFLERLFY